MINFSGSLICLFTFSLLFCDSISVAIETNKPIAPKDLQIQAIKNNKLFSQYLVGTWIGFTEEDGSSVEQKTIYSEKGSFETHFKKAKIGSKAEEWLESGLWGISGPVYFTITDKVLNKGKNHLEGKVPPFYSDAYEIKSISEGFLSLQSFSSKRMYHEFKDTPCTPVFLGCMKQGYIESSSAPAGKNLGKDCVKPLFTKGNLPSSVKVESQDILQCQQWLNSNGASK